MTTHITIEQHMAELRAEGLNTTSKRERKRILEELRLCELMLLSLEWKAQAEAAQGR
ncbi:hypothetical protein QE385_003246 [Sphingomonas sp. SORGH_AS 950]|uniref:hypothetical protein n=1 Tax=Sphingomonas sp. SORGH_AS_0950 TaxID=3041792 RepID=UPI0027872651|nr:hypothetical protein [Sphingomonas sp. SORGH_AS_0950]MDQ1158919.1 hypothetical protein [Sphingomonas sp. SORGH_AS_0950]